MRKENKLKQNEVSFYFWQSETAKDWKKNTQNNTVNSNYSTPQFNRDKQKKINIKIKIWNQIE
jgi:hypothetical protein